MKRIKFINTSSKENADLDDIVSSNQIKTCVPICPGSPEEKSKLMFSMNDIGGTGFLSKEEFARMLRFDQFF